MAIQCHNHYAKVPFCCSIRTKETQGYAQNTENLGMSEQKPLVEEFILKDPRAPMWICPWLDNNRGYLSHLHNGLHRSAENLDRILT